MQSFIRIGCEVQVVVEISEANQSIGTRGEIVGAFNFACKRWPVRFSTAGGSTDLMLDEAVLVSEEFVYDASPQQISRFLAKSCPDLMAKNLLALAQIMDETWLEKGRKGNVFSSLHETEDNISEFIFMISRSEEFQNKILGEECLFSDLHLTAFLRLLVLRIKRESESFRWLNYGEMTQTCLNLIESMGSFLSDTRIQQFSESVFDAIQNAIDKLQTTSIILEPNSKFLSVVYGLVTAFGHLYIFDLEEHLVDERPILDTFLQSKAIFLLLTIGITFRHRLDHDLLPHEATCPCCDLLVPCGMGKKAANNIFAVLQVCFSNLRFLGTFASCFSPLKTVRNWIDQQVTCRAELHQNGTNLDDLAFAGSICPEEMMQFHSFLVQFDNAKIRHLCNCCGAQIKSKSCGRCRQVFYCSQDCQIADWSTHSQICQTFNFHISKHQLPEARCAQQLTKSQKRRLKKKEKAGKRLDLEAKLKDDLGKYLGENFICHESHDQEFSKIERNLKSDKCDEIDKKFKLVFESLNADSLMQINQGDASASNAKAVSNLMMTAFCRLYSSIQKDIITRMKDNDSLNLVDLVVLLDPSDDAQENGYTLATVKDLATEIQRNKTHLWIENFELFRAHISETILNNQILVVSRGISYFMFPIHDGTSGKSWT